ncbi:MAG: hemerythrin domain-containing protein [Blastocatellia bacterium]|nr:hemerythrin domain-containing protein [Blastocatellia bacterium]
MRPTDVLKSEHRVIEKVLRALQGICARLERGDEIAPDALSRATDFIQTFADGCHHAKEETHLFPALLDRGLPHEGGPLGVMLYEHEIGRALVAELAGASEAYARKERGAGLRFAEIARQYIELLALHIQKEDNVLFNIADQLLDEESIDALQAAFEQEKEKTYPGLHERYERIAEELENEFGQ